MDFEDTKEEAEFRAKAIAFLDSHRERKADVEHTMSSADDRVAMLKEAKEWQLLKHDAGFTGMTVSKDYGGQGLPQIFQVIYNQEEGKYVVPRGVFDIGLGMCIPTMLAFATEEQKGRYAVPAFRGDEIWCQLFSEPAGGSDLAGLRTKAVQDGDDWIINGQKIWTTGAQFSDYGIIVTRSDFDVAKHKGLTFFFLDMKSPGVEVKPIKQASGASNFNEVFFTDVRIPDSQRLGDIGQGWQVSLTTLMNERFSITNSPPPNFQEVFDLARSAELEDGPAMADSAVREKLADWYVREQGIKLTNFRTMTALSRGGTPGPESSISKVVAGKQWQDISSFGMDLQDIGGIVEDPDMVAALGLFQSAYLSSPSYRIAGGTDEVLRNIIAERVLGLPADIRVDKTKPFNDLPTGRGQD
jgi:alkylation response protein AidB-like acyl-CoA dehydrogenase